MPKLYDYFGIIVMFYANEHEPVHVHGKYQGCESRALIVLVDGEVQGLELTPVAGRPPLPPAQRRQFEELVQAKAQQIVGKWIDYFVLNKPIQSETLTRRLK
jgi:hypothetical protein